MRLLVLLVFLAVLKPAGAEVLLKVSSEGEISVSTRFLDVRTVRHCVVRTQVKPHIPIDCLKHLGQADISGLGDRLVLKAEVIRYPEHKIPHLAVAYTSDLPAMPHVLGLVSLPEARESAPEPMILRFPLSYLSRAEPSLSLGPRPDKPFSRLEHSGRKFHVLLQEDVYWNQGPVVMDTALAAQRHLGLVSLELETPLQNGINPDLSQSLLQIEEVSYSWILGLLPVLLLFDRRMIRRKLALIFVSPVVVILYFVAENWQNLGSAMQASAELDLKDSLKNEWQQAILYSGRISQRIYEQAQSLLASVQTILMDKEHIRNFRRRVLELEPVLQAEAENPTQFSNLLKRSADKGEKQYRSLISDYGLEQKQMVENFLRPTFDLDDDRSLQSRLLAIEMFDESPLQSLLTKLTHQTGLDYFLTDGTLTISAAGINHGAITKRAMVSIMVQRLLKEAGIAPGTDAIEVAKSFTSADIIAEFDAASMAYDQLDRFLNRPYILSNFGSVNSGDSRLHNWARFKDGEDRPWILWGIGNAEIADYAISQSLKHMGIKDFVFEGAASTRPLQHGHGQGSIVCTQLSQRSVPVFVIEKTGQGADWLWYGGSLPGLGGRTLALARPLKPIQQRVAYLRLGFFIILLGFVVLACLMILKMSHRTYQPIQALSSAVARVRGFDYSQDIQVRTADEFSLLAYSFQKLLLKLRRAETILGFLDKNVRKGIQQDEPTRLQSVTILFCGLFQSGVDVGKVNEFVCTVQSIAMLSGGVIDKFTSEAVIVIYGSGHAHQAIEAGLQIRQKLGKWKLGIGIASGEVVRGHIGAPGRKDYTVIGDTVNLAARLEGLGKSQDGSTIYLCENTSNQARQWIDGIPHEELLVELKGKSDKLRVTRC